MSKSNYTLRQLIQAAYCLHYDEGPRRAARRIHREDVRDADTMIASHMPVRAGAEQLLMDQLLRGLRGKSTDLEKAAKGMMMPDFSHN